MSNPKIKKAKIKDDLFLEVEFTEQLPGHSKKDVKMSCTVPIHDDLKASFQALHKHLVVLCDEADTPSKKAFKTASFEGFNVKGFSIGGNDEHEGITISGNKEGTYGTVNLNSPFTKYEDSEYPFLSDLAADMETALYEVDQYLFHEKRAPEKQLEMDFEAGAEEQNGDEKLGTEQE